MSFNYTNNHSHKSSPRNSNKNSRSNSPSIQIPNNHEENLTLGKNKQINEVFIFYLP